MSHRKTFFSIVATAALLVASQAHAQQPAQQAGRTNEKPQQAAPVQQAATKPAPAKRPTGSSDAMFKKVTDTLLTQFWSWHPNWATTVGFHRFDEHLDLPNANRFSGKLINYRNWLKTVDAFGKKDLSPSARMDYEIFRNQLRYMIWRLDTFKSYTWNPAEYNLGEVFELTLANPNRSLRDKMSNVSSRLTKINQYYMAAQENMDKPTREHLDLAIMQLNGSLTVFEKTIPDSLAKLRDDKLTKDITAQLGGATQAIQRFVKFLEDYKKNAKAEYRDYRLTKDQYNKKFNYEIQSRYTAQEIYNRAQSRKKELHDEMQRLTTKLWPKYFANETQPSGLAGVKKMIDKLSEQHANRDSFLEAVQSQIPELEKFVKEKDLLSLDPTKPLVVRQTPAYMEGSGAGASINDPGPYNSNGKTYYNVSLLTNYTPEQAESYLREYNDYILQILNIHEAVPGHYTQLVYANQSPSAIKSVFGNGAMVEGWAVYTERMMLEEGYKATDEMWLMYNKWHLRSVINTILDYSVHNLNMTEAAAKKLMVDEGFQQQAEADNKWKRATISQVQLTSYFTGYTEIYDLRDELKKQQGEKFNLKAFHEKFLSYGSAPVKFIRETMLGDLQ